MMHIHIHIHIQLGVESVILVCLYLIYCCIKGLEICRGADGKKINPKINDNASGGFYCTRKIPLKWTTFYKSKRQLQ
jgi:hypothetical protein